MILGAGDPDGGSHVRLPGSGRSASYGDLRGAAVAFARGWRRAPLSPHLTLVLMVAGDGPDVDGASGRAWGGLVTEVAHRLSGVDVRGGLDVEVEWAPAKAVRTWLSGYLAATDRPFVDVGACTCPPYAAVRNGWTIGDLVAVADAAGRGSVVPQIYATAGGSAVEWATLARWAVAHRRPPVRFAGVLTERSACDGPPRRACAGIDLEPVAAWRQLSAASGQSLRWATDVGYLDAPGPVSRSAWRVVAVAAVGLALAGAVTTLGMVGWRGRLRRRRGARSRRKGARRTRRRHR